MNDIDVWIIHKRKVVQVTDIGGIPTEVTGYVSAEAKKAAESRGYPTISEIGFNADDHKSFDDFETAEKWAEEKAKELGYTVERSIWAYEFDDSEDEYIEDDDYEEWDDDE